MFNSLKSEQLVQLIRPICVWEAIVIVWLSLSAWNEFRISHIKIINFHRCAYAP